jgi:PAS domain S-box-containing protein
MAAGVPVQSAEQLRAQLNELIVRRARIGLGAILAGVLVAIVVDHAMLPARPLWADLVDATGIGLVLTAFWLLGRPAVRVRPVPLALIIVAVVCGMRAMSGIWFGDVGQTAILCVVVALAAGATLPWGVWPQLVSVVCAGAAIVANAHLVGVPVADPPAHLAAAVITALALSVVLSIELQRHRLRLFDENAQRRRAEHDLAHLNAELERRVALRTAELDATTRRLEREAIERQQASHELRQSQKRLQDILDNAAAAIQLKDVDGRYQLVNRHWEAAFGLRCDDAVGKTMHDIFPAAIADTLRANDRTVLATGEPLQIEETLQQRDGLHTYVSVKFPLIDPAGVPIGVCGISTDITAQKEAEAELRRSQAALSTLVENTTDSIWSMNRDGVIQAVNTAFRKRFRRRFGVDYDGTVSEALLPKAIWNDLVGLYERAFQGEHVQIEYRIPLDGVPEYFLISVYPIVENGVVTGATVFSKDITERKRVEAQARQHQAELAHVLRLGTMGEMAAGLAHEINQPLGAIANYAQGCVRRLRNGSLDAAGLLPVVEQIAAEALRGGAIIRRLRDLIRKEGPQQEAVDLNRLVRESTLMIEGEARQHGIRIQLDLADDLPVVSCDGIQIEQVLLNLLLNGVEAVQAAANGERTLAITTTPAADGVEVAIRDSGVGVPDPPEAVFKPFFSTKPNGLGMGLSISRSIIEAHGGHLSAARNDGCGSTFRFTLPVGDGATTKLDLTTKHTKTTKNPLTAR